MEAIEYRAAGKADLPGLLELYRQLLPDEDPIPLDRAAEIWNWIGSNVDLRYFLALDGDKPISTCNIAIIPNLTRDGRPYAVIENVVTAAAYRRRGIGRRVIEAAVQYARSRGCYKVLLMSSADRTESHRFYEAIGFNGDAKRGFEIRML